jgi:hypothetical protein
VLFQSTQASGCPFQPWAALGPLSAIDAAGASAPRAGAPAGQVEAAAGAALGVAVTRGEVDE